MNMNYPNKIILIVVFLNFFFGLSASCAESGNNGAMEINMENLTAEEIIRKADKMFSSRKYDEAREIYLRAAETAGAEQNNSVLTEAYARIARTYLISEKKEQGRAWLEKAARIASPEEPSGWSRYLGVRGRFEWKDEDLKTAAATFKEMYDYCSGRKMHDRAIDAAHMVAIVGTPEEQIEWGMKGISEAEQSNATNWLGPLWNNLAWTYETGGDFEKTLEAYLKARENHWKYGDEMNKLISDWAVGHAHRLLGNYDSAMQWIRPVLAWAERIDAAEWIGWSNKELGEAEMALGNDSAALNYLTEAEKFLRQSGMEDWDPQGFEEIREKIKSLRK